MTALTKPSRCGKKDNKNFVAPLLRRLTDDSGTTNDSCGFWIVFFLFFQNTMFLFSWKRQNSQDTHRFFTFSICVTNNQSNTDWRLCNAFMLSAAFKARWFEIPGRNGRSLFHCLIYFKKKINRLLLGGPGFQKVFILAWILNDCMDPRANRQFAACILGFLAC